MTSLQDFRSNWKKAALTAGLCQVLALPPATAQEQPRTAKEQKAYDKLKQSMIYGAKAQDDARKFRIGQIVLAAGMGYGHALKGVYKNGPAFILSAKMPFFEKFDAIKLEVKYVNYPGRELGIADAPPRQTSSVAQRALPVESHANFLLHLGTPYRYRFHADAYMGYEFYTDRPRTELHRNKNTNMGLSASYDILREKDGPFCLNLGAYLDLMEFEAGFQYSHKAYFSRNVSTGIALNAVYKLQR